MQENEVKNENVDVVEQPKEEKKSLWNFLKGYFKGLGFDFIQSFKYNKMKLPGLLILIPGAIFGFFLVFHTGFIHHVKFGSTYPNKDYFYDFTGIALFFMMLFGILNIFTGFSVMNKKNKGSVVLATITSLLMLAAATLFLVNIIIWMNGLSVHNNQVNSLVDEIRRIKPQAFETEEQLYDYANGYIFYEKGDEPITGLNWYVFALADDTKLSDYIDIDAILSLGSIAFCIISSTIGCILGFKNYDRDYQKVDR